jgi:hypothetical protein
LERFSLMAIYPERFDIDRSALKFWPWASVVEHMAKWSRDLCLWIRLSFFNVTAFHWAITEMKPQVFDLSPFSVMLKDRIVLVGIFSAQAQNYCWSLQKEETHSSCSIKQVLFRWSSWTAFVFRKDCLA